MAVVAVGGPTPVAAGWSLVFEDNFDGSQLDRARWATRYIYGNETLDRLNDELERFRDKDNHVIRNGTLELTARKVGPIYESGMIRSRQTFYFGYFESRVKMPSGRGVSPAFWLNPDYDINGRLMWPPEIDIFEYALNVKDDKPNMFHSAGSTVPRGSPPKFLYTDEKFQTRNQSYYADAPISDDWHVFGLLWQPGSYTVYFDKKKVYTRAFDWLGRNGEDASPAHVLLNLAIGGSWAGRYGVDDARFPQALGVDYVKVCQYGEGTGEPSCPGVDMPDEVAATRYAAPAGDLAKPIVEEGSIVGADGETSAGGKGKLASAAARPSRSRQR